MRDSLQPLRILALLGFVLALFAVSCSRNNEAPALAGNSVVSGAQLARAVGVAGAYLGDGQYAVVSTGALAGFYDAFRAEIFRQGVTRWDDRFDCNHFAGYYVELAQTRFYLASYQSRTPAQTLAMGVYWYRPTWAKGQAHAVVVAMTEQGLTWIEPQTGQRFTPTAAEQMTAYLKVF